MLDHQTKERSDTAPTATTNRWLIAITVVLALAVIGVAAWAVVEGNRADDLSTDLDAAESRVDDLEGDLTVAEAEIASLETQLAVPTDAIVVGGGQLTARQEEMVALITGPWAEAWQAADGEAVASLFTPDGVMYDIGGGDVLTVADGTIEAFARQWSGLRHRSGMLVHGDRVIAVVQLAGREVGAIIEFTGSGDLLVESNAMYDSELAPDN